MAHFRRHLLFDLLGHRVHLAADGFLDGFTDSLADLRFDLRGDVVHLLAERMLDFRGDGFFDLFGDVTGHPLRIEPGHFPPDVYDIGGKHPETEGDPDHRFDDQDERDGDKDQNAVGEIDDEVDLVGIHTGPPRTVNPVCNSCMGCGLASTYKTPFRWLLRGLGCPAA